MYYNWKQKAKIFSWFSIFDNNLTKDNYPYLKDVQNKYIYNTPKDNIYWHTYILWMTNNHINRMRKSKHYYIDFTYIRVLLVMMYYDDISDKKIPGIYLLINTKFESSYIIVFESIVNLIFKTLFFLYISFSKIFKISYFNIIYYVNTNNLKKLMIII